ncbi:MAG: ATP-binding protein [Alloprevotella sp.]
MKRKIFEALLQWKNSEKGRVALLVEGARRVGKSYIVEAFAKEAYRSYVMIDLSYMPAALKSVFDDYLNDVPMFLSLLQNVTGVRLYERESLIVFDEVQAYPKVRQAIKHLVADGRYDYIETGSLVGIMENTQGILLPSEERILRMCPMDFEEFLWAMGDEMTMPFIRMCFEGKKPLGPMHRKAMELFRQYMIVGGMPQAVERYAQTKLFQDADIAKRDILALYRRSVGQYAKGYAEKVKAVFDNIPAELQRHEKRFRLSSIENGARYRSYESSFLWLKDAMITNMCYGVTAPSAGMRLTSNETTFKCYMADTGLLISHAFDEKAIQGEELYQKLMLGKLEINSGMLVENVVAQMLVASGHRLYFYSNNSRTDAEERMEIDFLVEKPQLTNAHNICPVEVKSGKNYTTVSLNKFCRRFERQLYTPYIIHYMDLKTEGGIVYLPIYMVPLL